MKNSSQQVFVEDLMTQVDLAYSLNRDSPNRKDVKQYIETAYQILSSVCPEKDFHKKSQYDFHGMMWQLHLAFLLKQNGFTLLPTDSHGPDIIVQYGNSKILIEAMDVSAGVGLGSVADIPMDEPTCLPNPDTGVMFRIITAMEKKMSQHAKWLQKNRVLPSDPYIVALNTGTIAASQFTPDYSYPVKSVFALGEQGWVVQVSMDPRVAGPGTTNSYVRHMPQIEITDGTSTVTKPTDWFLTDKCPEVSGLIWCWHHIANSLRYNGPHPIDWRVSVIIV